MGLTLHFDLQADVRTRSQAKRLVATLRQRTLKLGMAHVGRLRIYPLPGVTATGRKRVVPPEYRIDGSQLLRSGDSFLAVEPLALVCFQVHPAPGSETARVGLARYPRFVRDERGRRRSTKLSGWRWHNFCKTQYASNPRHGGIENFLRAHLSLVAMLDEAIDLGLHVKVTDEGGYWDHRDRERLAKEVNDWNMLVAGVVGRFKDAAGSGVTAEIFKFPNFEHLEARDRLKRQGSD